MSVRFARIDGRDLDWDVERWIGHAEAEDLEVLDRATPPVLDIGCGPGRHVLALARRGVVALGVDVASEAVGIARARGAAVLERSVFERVPAAGRWGCALLLDGNIGIGGDPQSLLMRAGELLQPQGRVLVEVDPPGTQSEQVFIRVDGTNISTTPFAWAIVGADSLRGLAERSGFTVSEIWDSNGRWFGCLDR